MKVKNIIPTQPFQSSGITKITETGDIFIDLVPSMLNLLSAGDELIANKIQNNSLGPNEPSFFQLPYIVSIIDNVNKYNYTSSSSTNGNLVTSIYKIPYKALIGESIAIFITFYNTEKELLNYQIPRELSYNSVDQASVYVTKSIYTINCNLIIPNSFFLSENNLEYYFLSFTININNSIPNIENRDILVDKIQTSYSYNSNEIKDCYRCIPNKGRCYDCEEFLTTLCIPCS